MNCIWGYQHSSPCWIYRAWNRKSKYDSKATLNDACQNHDSLTMTYCTLLWTLKIMTNAKVIIWGQAQGSNGIHVLALQNHWNPLQSRKRRQSDYRYIYKKKKKRLFCRITISTQIHHRTSYLFESWAQPVDKLSQFVRLIRRVTSLAQSFQTNGRRVNIMWCVLRTCSVWK